MATTDPIAAAQAAAAAAAAARAAAEAAAAQAAGAEAAAAASTAPATTATATRQAPPQSTTDPAFTASSTRQILEDTGALGAGDTQLDGSAIASAIDRDLTTLPGTASRDLLLGLPGLAPGTATPYGGLETPDVLALGALSGTGSHIGRSSIMSPGAANPLPSGVDESDDDSRTNAAYLEGFNDGSDLTASVLGDSRRESEDGLTIPGWAVNPVSTMLGAAADVYVDAAGALYDLVTGDDDSSSTDGEASGAATGADGAAAGGADAGAGAGTGQGSAGEFQKWSESEVPLGPMTEQEQAAFDAALQAIQEANERESDDSSSTTASGTTTTTPAATDTTYQTEDQRTFNAPRGWIDSDDLLRIRSGDILTGATGRQDDDGEGRLGPQGGGTTTNPAPESGGTPSGRSTVVDAYRNDDYVGQPGTDRDSQVVPVGGLQVLAPDVDPDTVNPSGGEGTTASTGSGEASTAFRPAIMPAAGGSDDTVDDPTMDMTDPTITFDGAAIADGTDQDHGHGHGYGHDRDRGNPSEPAMDAEGDLEE